MGKLTDLRCPDISSDTLSNTEGAAEKGVGQAQTEQTQSGSRGTTWKFNKSLGKKNCCVNSCLALETGKYLMQIEQTLAKASGKVGLIGLVYKESRLKFH